MRRTASIVAGIFAVIALFLVIAMPSDVSNQAANSREYERQLRSSAVYVEETLKKSGQLPTDTDLEQWANKKGYSIISGTLTATQKKWECDGNFQLPKGDRFLLTFWRGEWWECYASPSGRTTLVLSTTDLLTSGLWINLAIYCFVVIVFGWCAWRIWPTRV